jgi:hypothetical protein
MTFDKVRVKMNRLHSIDLRKGKIFSDYGQSNGPNQSEGTVVVSDQEMEVFTHQISDCDSVIKGYETRKHLRSCNVDQSFSAPHTHNRSPAEVYMRKVGNSASAMQNLAGLPNSLLECMWAHSAMMHSLTLPRRRYDEGHKFITPLQAFTKQVPQWKHIEGWVPGMQCWAYLEKDRSETAARGKVAA